MLWWIFAVISILGISFSRIFQRVLMRDDEGDPVAYTIVFEILSALLVEVFAIFHGFYLPPIAQHPINFLLVALLYGLGMVFLFKANQSIEASEVAVVTSLVSIVAAASAVLLLGEIFSLKKLAGTLLILAAVLLVTNFKRGLILNKGVLYALGTALCVGLAITNDAFILHSNRDAFSYSAVSFFLVGSFLIVARPQSLKKIRDFAQVSKLSKMILFAASYSVANVAFVYALQLGAGASQLGPMNQSFVVVTVLLSAVFLGERSNLFRKILAAIVVLAGVVMLS